MKKSLIVGLLGVIGFSSMASAHDYNGVFGTTATATDKFYITCAAGTAKFTYQVRRNAGAVNIKAQATSPVGTATTSSGTGVFSPLITVNTGGGAKFFQVNKNTSSTATAGYTLRMHCWDTAGNHNPDDQPTTVTYTQNQ